MHNNQSQETIDIQIILRETIKEKLSNFLRDRMSTNGSSKTQIQKDGLQLVISLTCATTSSLTHAPQLSVSVCDK